MSTDNFGALGADFFIRTFDKSSLMSQSDLDQLIQYVQLTTTIIAVGEFTPGVQQSVWMILERVDVPSAPGYTVTNNTEVTMTSGGLVTIDSIPWTKITGKPSIPTDINDLTDTGGLLANTGDFTFTGGTASLPADSTMILDTFQVGGNKQSTLTLSTATISSLDAGNNLRLRTGYGTGFEKDWILGADGSIRFPDASVQTTAYTGSDHAAYEITNTSPEGSIYSVSVGTDGVVSMVTSRGGIEFGAMPEVGGPTHFHIMRPAGDNGTDLYFGDDYNYVLQRPSAYGGAPAYGVEIGANDNNGGAQQVWRFGTDGHLTLPAGGDIKDSTGASVLGGGFSGDYDDLTNKPTYRIAVPTGTGPGGNLQADSLALAGLNPVTDIPSTWGGDLILQGGVGGANSDLYGEVRIKSGQIGANYEWHFTTDKKIKLPAGGSIVDSTGANVFVSLTTLKQVVADSTDFADFQTRIAGM